MMKEVNKNQIMSGKKKEKLRQFFESNRIPLLVFFSSMFVFISFAGTRLFLSDEGIILDQFYNLINGSLALKIAKINVDKGIYITIGNNLYGKFSYSLPILSIPTYYILKIIDSFYGAHLFILQLWAAIGGIVVFLMGKIRKMKYAEACGIISYIVLVSINLSFLKPIYFPKWGELLSIEFTNIIISSFLILIIYLFFRKFFSDKIALFASFFILFATPIPFYAISLKHHSLTLFLTLLSFYFFYKNYERKDNKFIYLSYIFAGICVWTRILDGSVLLVSLLIADFLIFKRSIRYISSISIVILLSLSPLFMFNYLILGNPFSNIENTPLTNEPVKIITAKDYIVLDQNKNATQAELLNDLGYTWEGKIKGYWFEVLAYSMFLKLINTSGIFIVSPFLIAALGFIVSRVKHRMNWNPVDKLLGLYVILLLGTYSILHVFFNIRPLISVITDTPVSLEYRYLLILYVILVYFALRVDNVRELIEKRSGSIIKLYGIILLIFIIYFIAGYPINFITLYYYTSLLIISFLFLLIITYHPVNKRRKILDMSLHGKMLLLLIAFAFAQGSAFLLFYYWVVNMSYLSPSQNIPVIPLLNYIIEWMYRTIIF